MYKRKWKPNKAQKEAFKSKLVEQENQLTQLIDLYQNEIEYAYWNDNKSSLYMFLKNGESYRISTHHLPNRDWEFQRYGIGEKYRDCSFVQKEIVTNSRDNIIKKAVELLENCKDYNEKETNEYINEFGQNSNVNLDDLIKDQNDDNQNQSQTTGRGGQRC